MHANHDLPTVAISQFTTMTRSFEDDLVDYRNAGICAIEVCETKMSPDPEAARQQLQRVVDAGFEIASVQPRVHSPFPDEMAETPEDPADRRAAFEKTIDLVADVVGEDSQTPLLTITGKAPQHNFRESWQTAAAWYRDVADAAAKRGLRIAFEPLHPTHANINTFITSLDQARRMLAEVGRPNFGLCFDTFNSWEERDLPLRLKRLAPSIFLFQACDWPEGGPRRLHDRTVPGAGRIDLPALIEAVDEAGYPGPWVVEILSDPDLPDSHWNDDPAELLPRCREGFLSAWRAAREEEATRD